MPNVNVAAHAITYENGRIYPQLASSQTTDDRGEYRMFWLPPGDYVVVVNCEKVKFSGKKWEQKEYAWFTGYTGQRTETAATRRDEHPDRILRDAVRRMLPKNDVLARKMLSKLKLFAGPSHDHQAQQPEAKELGV